MQYVGSGSTGIFTQSGGTNTLAGNLCLGCSAGSSGTYVLSGSGLLSTQQNEYLGYAGSGTFTQSGGTHAVGGNFYLGSSASTSGVYSLGSGLLAAHKASASATTARELSLNPAASTASPARSPWANTPARAEPTILTADFWPYRTSSSDPAAPR